jgi:hypothetical protein
MRSWSHSAFPGSRKSRKAEEMLAAVRSPTEEMGHFRRWRASVRCSRQSDHRLFRQAAWVFQRYLNSQGTREFQRCTLAAICDGRRVCCYATPTSKRTAPIATSARPGQFDLMPKPRAGAGGLSVSMGLPERSRLGR